jgi:radical SAM superfamily enzyme YgiQ (UPF0313 family)
VLYRLSLFGLNPENNSYTKQVPSNLTRKETKMKLALVMPQPEDQIFPKVKRVFRFPLLNLPLLAALTPADVEIKIMDQLVEHIDYDGGYDLVGISMTTAVAPIAYKMAEKFKERGCKVIFGGHHPSVMPEEVLPHGDAILIGEAEDVWHKVIEDFKNNNLQKIYKAPKQTDFKNLPLPRWDLLDGKPYFIKKSIIASRGCHWKCEFCSINLPYGGGYRNLPMDYILKAVEASDKMIMFWDDDIISNPHFAKDMMRKLIPYKKKWLGQMTVNICKDDELLDLAIKSGCRDMFMGLETISQESLQSVSKVQNSVRKYDEFVKKLHDRGVAVHAGIVFGFDHDDKSSFERTVEWMNRVGIDGAFFRVLTPYPGTELYKRLEKEGRIISKDWTRYDGSHAAFIPAKMSPEELEAGMQWAKKNFYSYPAMLGRAFRSGTKFPKKITYSLGYKSMFPIQEDIPIFNPASSAENPYLQSKAAA